MNYLRLLHILRKQRQGLLLVGCATLMLMSCGVDRNIKKGDKHLSLGEYYDAATQFKTAYQRTSPKDRRQRGELSLKMADCYSRIASSPLLPIEMSSDINKTLVRHIKVWLII